VRVVKGNKGSRNEKGRETFKKPEGVFRERQLRVVRGERWKELKKILWGA